MQKHIRENVNVIYAYEPLENILNNSNINFIGNNNILFLSSNLKLYDSTIKFNNNNSIGFLCSGRIDKLIVDLHNDNVLYIGEYSFFNPNGHRYMALAETKNIIIGNKCLFSNPIEFHALDWHLIYENENGTRLNQSKSIYIGDHVWVGADAYFLKGSMVYSGAIIGARSLATRNYYSNTVNAGNPAKQIKDNVFWHGDCPKYNSNNDKKYLFYYDDDFKYAYNQDEFLSPKAIEAKLDSLNTVQEKLEFVYDAIYMNKNKNRFAYFKDMPYDIPLPKYERKFKLLKFEEIESTPPKPVTPPQPATLPQAPQLTPQEQIKVLQDKIKELETSNQKALKTKNHLSYKLGNALIKAHKQWYKGGYIKFIFEAIKINKEHKIKR
ncbi:MAG: acyltransferase [Campylobacter lanienae]|nr:acyltransferase [Campylobacter lanienae]